MGSEITIGELSLPGVPVEAEKLRFVETVVTTLREGPVALAVDFSGYGEEGWSDSAGFLHEDDATVVALTAWYRYLRVLPHPQHLVHQEAVLLSSRPYEVAQERPLVLPEDTGQSVELQLLLKELYSVGWTDETGSAGYGARDRSSGQCAVTALLVQDRFGGDLLRYQLEDGSHYANRLPDGRLVDLTRAQFERFAPTAPVETRSREYLLGNDETHRRYLRLLENLS